MKPIRLRGDIIVDPADEDFFIRVIEHRKQIDTDPAAPATEREWLSQFLKILANATSYGILAEYIRHEGHDRSPSPCTATA